MMPSTFTHIRYPLVNIFTQNVIVNYHLLNPYRSPTCATRTELQPYTPLARYQRQPLVPYLVLRILACYYHITSNQRPTPGMETHPFSPVTVPVSFVYYKLLT